MAQGDIPVDGSAVVTTKSGEETFFIDARRLVDDGNLFLTIRTTQGKKLHVKVDADATNPRSKKFDEDVDKDNWTLEISERP